MSVPVETTETLASHNQQSMTCQETLAENKKWGFEHALKKKAGN